MKKLVLLILSLCMLFCAISCKKKNGNENESETTGEKQMETSPILINGNPISEYQLFSDGDVSDGVAILRSAIQNYAGIALRMTRAMPDDGKVICFRIDPHQLPDGCRIQVEGNTLYLSLYHKSFLGAAVGRFKTLLTGETVAFGADFDQVIPYEPVSYSKVSSGKNLQVIGDADRDALSYRVGDTAWVHVAAATTTGDLVSVPYFHLTIYNESKGKISDTYQDGTSGGCTFNITPKSAGFIYWNVQACDANKKEISRFNRQADGGNHFVGSIGFDVETLTPATELPSDFDSFWNGIAGEVGNTALEILKVEQVSGQSGYHAYYVELRCGTDAKGEPGIAAGYLTYPSNASAKTKIGLRIAFQGHSLSLADKIYQKETAVLSVCAHSIDMERAKSDGDYYDEMKKAIGDRFGFESGGRDQNYFLQMIRRDLTAAKFLIEYFGESGNQFWNGTDFEVSGTSMGAFQSTAVTALMKEATGREASLLKLSLPWMCDVNGTSVGRKESSYRPRYRDALAYYDTVLFARHVTCKTTIYAGLGDQVCPASGVMVLYNVLNCEKTLTFEQNTSHSGGVGGEQYCR